MTSNVHIVYGDDEGIMFEVSSSRNPTEKYIVNWDFDNGWLCDCQGCLQGHHFCRHIQAAEVLNNSVENIQ